MVSHQYWNHEQEDHQIVGSPPFPVDKMGTPQRAGEKMNWIPYFFGLIPNLPALFRNRPSITSTRLRSVSDSMLSLQALN